MLKQAWPCDQQTYTVENVMYLCQKVAVVKILYTLLYLCTDVNVLIQNWQPPFAVDIDSFRFTPRIQRLNELEVM